MSEPTPLLVRRHLEDDASAFPLLMRRYQELVFGLCYRMLGHRQDAEDVTQETFTRLARHLGRWDATRPLEPWLLAIAGNRCRTLLSRRRVTVPLVESPEPATDAADQTERAALLAEEVHLALQTLRPEHRQAFLMFHQRHLSHAEIARHMGCAPGTVKTWVHRARAEVIRRLRQRQVFEEGGHAM